MSVFFAALAAVAAYGCYFLLSRCREQLHMLQLNTYVNRQHRDWVRQHGRRLHRPAELLLFLPAPLLLLLPLTAALLVLLAVALVLLLLIYRPGREKAKKPLVFTPRMKRLFAATAVLAALWTLLLAAFALFGLYLGGRQLLLSGRLLPLLAALLALTALMFAGCRLSWLLVLAANALRQPAERRLNNRFFTAAQAKLAAMPQLQTVGVTGSFGKTSVKMIAAAILREKYQVLATPASYNTPMGVSRIVNETLSPLDEIFICEMGARHRGDIQEMCELAPPDLAILTNIGEQHLETFGSLENIIAAKFDIIRALPAGGVGVVNGDNPHIAAHLADFPDRRLVTFGFGADNDFRAADLRFDRRGAAFTLYAEGEAHELTTPLLGRHNVSNILAGVALARQLDVDWKHIAHAVRRLTPVEHRLQLIPAGSYTVIDDAFNSNPAGAEAALEVLSGFTEGKRIIITPGMVELGEREYQLNYELGRALPAVCDLIILVGKRHSKPLQDGVLAAGCPPERLLVAADLNEARQMMAARVGAGDVVLFENDLPDTYNE